MLVHYFSLSVIFLDLIQLFSSNNAGGSRRAVASGAPNERASRELGDSLKKLGAYSEVLKNRKAGKNDKLLPLSSILDDDSRMEPRKKRAIASELIEINKEIQNAVGEQAENYPDPTPGYPTPEGLPDVSNFEDIFESTQQEKKTKKS